MDLADKMHALLVKLTCTVDTWVRQINYGYTYGLGLASVETDLITGDSNSNIVNSLAYRGFGGIKQMNYGNGRRLEVGYGLERQQLQSLAVKKQDGSDSIIDLSYDYENGGKNNGRIQKIIDNTNPQSSKTYIYNYDDYNRLKEATETAYLRQYESMLEFHRHGRFHNASNFLCN